MLPGVMVMVTVIVMVSRSSWEMVRERIRE